jgi:GT2 family glycosyltransferase
MFGTLGAFRDEFFMYGEDVEFCLRVRRCGLEIVVVPEARVTHEEPTPRVPTAIEFHKIKNFASLYFIHAPLTVLPVFVLRYGAAGMVRACSQGRGFLHLRAWTWALGHAPRLLLERFQPLESSVAGTAWR